MIIATPEISLRNGQVTVSARIQFANHPLNKPETAWFRLPEKYAPYISGRADAFAAALLPLAQALGEDLTIEGPLSPRLLNGMREYQLALAFWFPKLMRIVDIRADNLRPLAAEQAGRNCVALFSGGVDSSYTVLQHLPENQPIPDYQVRGALFVHGLDIPLQNQASYSESLQIFSQQLGPLGVELIPCATNLHYFSSGLLTWGIAHGGVITGSGLVLDGWAANLLVSSSYSLDGLIPWGSSPMIDHLLSTETLKVIHYGAAASRIDKVYAISGWQPAQNFLRVCVDEAHRLGTSNCSRCEKCIRTMSMLEICGTLSSFKTFKQPFRKGDIYRWTPHYEGGEVWVDQTIEFARRHGKQEFVFPVQVAHFKAKLRAWVYKRLPNWLFKRIKAQVFPYENDIFNPIFLPPEI
jgi:hypothetical protein